MILSSCLLWDGDDEKFRKAYKEILIIRELVEDSALAQKEVEAVYVKYGYSEESFKKDFYYFAENIEEFLVIMDTVREEAKREILAQQKKPIQSKDSSSVEDTTQNERKTVNSGH